MDPFKSNPATLAVYECAELLRHILHLCPWSTLVKLTHVDHWLRSVVFDLIRSRIIDFLDKFVDLSSISPFFALLESSGAAVVGALVRCILGFGTRHLYKDVRPRQMNIVVPYISVGGRDDSGMLNFEKWCRLLVGMEYVNLNPGRGRAVPYQLVATVKTWALYYRKKDDLHISLIQSRTPSAISPLLQSSQSSNFYVLSSTRLYSLYPNLFRSNVNLNMMERMPISNCVFDTFNYGLITFRSTSTWDLFEGECGEACPSVWRLTEQLPGTAVVKWGGFQQVGYFEEIAPPRDPYGSRREIWKVRGECSNTGCRNFIWATNLQAFYSSYP